MFDKKYFTYLFSLLFLILSFAFLVFDIRPYYIFVTDIEPAYYMSAYLILNNELPVFYFHPATLFQYLTAAMLKITNLTSLTEIPVSLKLLKLVAIIFNSIAIFYFLKISNKYKLNNSLRIIILAILYPATLIYVTYFGVNSIVLGLSLILSSIYIKNYYNNYNSLIPLGIISGICLNSKLIFLPCLIIIFINIFFSGNKLFDEKYLKKALIYLFVTSLVFFLVGFKMIHVYPEILIKIFNRPEGNLGILKLSMIAIISIILSFALEKKKNINIVIKNFFLIFFIFYFLFITYKYISIDYLPTYFRYQAAFFIFALVFININFKVKTIYLNILIFIFVCLFSITHYRNYVVTKNEIKTSLEYSSFIKEKISKNYFIYYWTGSGNNSYDKENFIEWADLRYGNSFIKKNKKINISDKQIYNIRLDIKNYDILNNKNDKRGFKQSLKKIFIKYKIFPKTQLSKNYYTIDHSFTGKCMIIVFNKDELDIEINKLKSSSMFQNKPSLFLQQKFGIKFKQQIISFGNKEFIVFTNDLNKCKIN